MTKPEPVDATVSELKPGMKNVNIRFKVVDKGEAREVTSRSDGSKHRVLDATVGDSTGTVVVPLWDESIDEMETGKTYELENGYTGTFRNHLRLKIGKYSELEEADEEIEEVNYDVNMSEEEHRDKRKRSYKKKSRPKKKKKKSEGYGRPNRSFGGYVGNYKRNNRAESTD
ncbi:MAG: single-stranded DNA-binding protein [Candidatus Lokiarchaeota archaeon]|jgi:replication factor A1|nr:single-stranded DNA-binding protein [Candidatus Lokiarchaeota archaeon]